MASKNELPKHVTKLANGKYRVRYKRNKTNPIKYDKTFDTEEEAIKANDIYKAKVTLNVYTKGTKDDIGFSDFCDFVLEWYRKAARKKAHNTIRSYKKYMNILKPLFNNKYIRDITTLEIENILAMEKDRNKKSIGAKDGEKISANTLHHEYTTLSMIFNKARKWHFIEVNPMEGVEAPKYKKKDIVVPEYEDLGEIENIIMNAPIRERCQFLLAFFGGIREEEVCGIHIDLINRENNTIHIKFAIVQNEQTGEYEETETKSESGEREIPYPERFFKVLDDYLIYRRNLVEYLKIKTDNKYEELPNLFLNKDGHYYRPREVGKNWRKFKLDKCKISDLTFHGLRHYYITNQVNYNPNLSDEEVKTLAGHASIVTTYGYVHHSNKRINKNAVEIFDKFSRESLYKSGKGKLSIPISHIATIVLGNPNYSKIEELQVTLSELTHQNVDFFNISKVVEKCKEFLLKKYPSLSLIEKSCNLNPNDSEVIEGLKKIYGSEFEVDTNVMFI